MSSRQLRQDLRTRSRKRQEAGSGNVNILANNCNSGFPEKGVDASTYMGN